MLLQPFSFFLFLGIHGLLSSPHVGWDVLFTIFTRMLLEMTEINYKKCPSNKSHVSPCYIHL